MADEFEWTPCRFCGKAEPNCIDIGHFSMECQCGAATGGFENQQDAIADWQMGILYPIEEIAGQLPDELVTLRARVGELERENAELKGDAEKWRKYRSAMMEALRHA